ERGLASRNWCLGKGQADRVN
ncbi:mCG146502, partial [Mus musculus]